MKKSQLRQIIKEEISKVLNEDSDDIKREIARVKEVSDYGYLVNSDGSTISVEGKYAGKKGEYTMIERVAFNRVVGRFEYERLTSGGLGGSTRGVKLNDKKLILTKIN